MALPNPLHTKWMGRLKHHQQQQKQQLKFNLFIDQNKLWVLTDTLNFEHPSQTLKLLDKNIFSILCSNSLSTWTYENSNGADQTVLARGFKTFMLNSTEHDISTAHKH